MKQLCNALSRNTGRLVVDATGIKGEFNIALNFH